MTFCTKVTIFYDAMRLNNHFRPWCAHSWYSHDFHSFGFPISQNLLLLFTIMSFSMTSKSFRPNMSNMMKGITTPMIVLPRAFLLRPVWLKGLANSTTLTFDISEKEEQFLNSLVTSCPQEGDIPIIAGRLHPKEGSISTEEVRWKPFSSKIEGYSPNNPQVSRHNFGFIKVRLPDELSFAFLQSRINRQDFHGYS